MGLLDSASGFVHNIPGAIGSGATQTYHKAGNGGQQLLQNPHQYALDHRDEEQTAGSLYYGGLANVSGSVYGGAVGSMNGASAGPGSGGSGSVGGAPAEGTFAAANIGAGYQGAHQGQMAPGERYDEVAGGANAFGAQEALQNEAARQKAAQDKEDNLLSQNAANFGEGFSGNATQNAARINSQRTALSQNAQQQGLNEADNAYQAGTTGNRIRQANSGTFGSGVDAQARNDLLGDYYNRVAGASNAGTNAGRGFDTNLQGQKSRIAGAIKNGQVTDATGMSYDAATLGNTNAYGTAVGASAGGLASGYSANLLNGAYRN